MQKKKKNADDCEQSYIPFSLLRLSPQWNFLTGCASQKFRCRLRHLRSNLTLLVHCKSHCSISYWISAPHELLPVLREYHLQSALLPNNVELHIAADSVCYSVRSSRICLYRADGNMYHFHRGAHHTKMRPPLTLTNEDDEHLRTFTVSVLLCDAANEQ